MAGTSKSAKRTFEHLFLRYGAGAHHFQRIVGCRLWNRLCWTIIAVGIAGWIVLFLVLRRLTE